MEEAVKCRKSYYFKISHAFTQLTKIWIFIVQHSFLHNSTTHILFVLNPITMLFRNIDIKVLSAVILKESQEMSTEI